MYTFNFKSLQAQSTGTKDLIVPKKGLQNIGSCIFSVFIRDTNQKFANFIFTEMPGCCGIIVSHQTLVLSKFRGSKYSDEFRELKQALAKELGYSKMIMTTQMNNIYSLNNANKSGYRIVDKFTNKRTHNLIGIGLKDID